MAHLKFRVPVIYGAAGIGFPGSGPKVTDQKEAQALLDTFCSYGPQAVDTSNSYGKGTSEELLAKLDLHGSALDTKIYPLAPGFHSTAQFKTHFEETLKRIGSVKIRVFYLHAPDHTVPFEETLAVVDEYYKKGAFQRFGLSNYKAFEVVEIYKICEAKGYVLPTVYEGIYNPIDRTVEAELIPALRRFNISFAAYSPLAGGFLTGLYLDQQSNIEPGSHFDANLPFGAFFQTRYFGTIPAVRELRDVVVKNGLNLNQASVRWLQHHSALIPSDLGIIFGGSKPSHIDTTLKYNGEGPLPQEVVDAFEETYQKVKGGLPYFNHDPFWWDAKTGKVAGK